MPSKSSTQRTLEIVRGHGATVAQVVEHWNAHAGQRRDLFGVVDVLALGPWGTLAIQATSASNVSSRVEKALCLDATGAMLAAGWRFEVWGLRGEPDRHGSTLKARSLLPGDGGEIRVSECSETLCNYSSPQGET